MTSVTTWDPQVDRTFALIEQLSEPLDEALCSQAVEAAIRTQKTQLASRFMDTLPGRWTVDETVPRWSMVIPDVTCWILNGFTMIYHEKLGCLWIFAKKTWISLARMDKNCGLLTKTMIIPTKRGIQRLKQQTSGTEMEIQSAKISLMTWVNH